MDDASVRQDQGSTKGWHPFQIDRISSQAAVAELGQAALDGSSVEFVFDLAMRLVQRALGVERAWILRRLEGGATARLVAHIGCDEIADCAIISCDADT